MESLSPDKVSAVIISAMFNILAQAGFHYFPYLIISQFRWAEIHRALTDQRNFAPFTEVAPLATETIIVRPALEITS
jgi:hypothetical protein